MTSEIWLLLQCAVALQCALYEAEALKQRTPCTRTSVMDWKQVQMRKDRNKLYRTEGKLQDFYISKGSYWLRNTAELKKLMTYINMHFSEYISPILRRPWHQNVSDTRPKTKNIDSVILLVLVVSLSIFHSYCVEIYIYIFSRHFYPKRLTVHSGYTFFGQYMCSLGIEPTTFALLTQCSNHWATGTLDISR